MKLCRRKASVYAAALAGGDRSDEGNARAGNAWISPLTNR